MATTFLVPKNNAVSTLDGGINDSVTSLAVAPGEGALFPSSFPFNITLEDEILKCTNRATDTFTVVRGEEGTTPASHADGKAVELRITAKAISDLNTAVNTLENAVPTEIVDGTSKFEVESTNGPLVGTVSGVEASRLSAVGIQTLAKQSGCKAYRETDYQSVPSGAWTDIDWTHEAYDYQNEYNLSTDRFTATEAGLYLLCLQAKFQSMGDGNNIAIRLKKNGTTAIEASAIAGAAGDQVANALTVVYLAANDYLEPQVYHNYGSARNLYRYEHLSFMAIQKVA
ncbi:unnamed protein product [marine sediment metagenome]|uniref:C1q domain-containing protein n=1 Tax=marine sediment metagenome TaxID=412755 RepID=X0SVA1_9ZZZZ